MRTDDKETITWGLPSSGRMTKYMRILFGEIGMMTWALWSSHRVTKTVVFVWVEVIFVYVM